MIFHCLTKCGPVNKNFLAMFLNIKNTGKEYLMNPFKFRLLKMNLKKSKLP